VADESGQREFTPLRLVKQAGAAAAAIASVIGLVVLVLSFVREDETPRTATLAARDQVDLNISLREYLEEYRNEEPPAGVTAERLARNGNVFFFDVELEGFEGERLVLRWSRFDATIRRRLPDVAFPEQQEELVAGRNRRIATDVWAPLPANVDAFFVRAELLDSEGERLATADSPTQQLLSP
jgi:hypothetical protein